jgi:uncharacterized protein YerC
VTHVSKHTLKPTVKTKISGNLVKAVTRNSEIINALLTRTEQIMLAKRFALIAMLEQGHSYYRIKQTLNVST